MSISILRRHWVFLAVFVLLGILFFGTIRPGQDWGGDFSVYVLEARNFAQHRPFDQTSYVPTVESMRNHPSVYPPLTSLILAPVYATVGLNFIAFKAVLVIFLWISIPIYYLIACRRGLTPVAAAAIMLIFGLMPVIFEVKEIAGSDSVCLFFAGLTILILDLIYRNDWDTRRPILAGVAAAVLLMLCYLTRVTGLALVGALAIFEIWRFRRVRWFSAVALGLTGLAILIYGRIVFHIGAQYGSQFPFLPKMYAENAVYYLQSPAALWAGDPSPVRYALALSLLGLCFIGFVRALRHLTVIEPYIILSMAVYISYTSTHSTRYMIPLLPLLLIYAAEALAWLSRALVVSNSTRRLALAGVAIVAILASAINLRAVETGPIQEGVAKPTFVEVCDYLKRQTPPDALVLSWNPRVFALYTEKQSALYPQIDSPDAFESDIPGHAPAYLVFYNHDLDRRKLTPYLRRAASRIRLVFDNRDFRVYELPARS